MSAILAIPFELRLVLMFFIGIVAGAFVNWAAYSLRVDPVPLSPWSRSHPRDALSIWLDRVPIYGWWRLERKGKQLGYEFWIRPLVVEVITGLLFVFFYWWEIGELGLVVPPLELKRKLPELLTVLHAQFAAHITLVTLMLAVTLIDIDEQTIPDALTVPGTLLGLAFAVLLPTSRFFTVNDVVAGLPAALQDFTKDPLTLPLQLASPNPWPPALDGAPQLIPLAIGLACFLLWCVALLPRPCYLRYGWRRACRYLVATIARERWRWHIAGMAVVGSTAIAGVWWQGGESWRALLSSLVGLAVGGGLIWIVRVIGQWAMGKEAMGFGDVTLMAMIGSFLGWQPCTVIFFLAPFAGLVVGLARWAVRRDNVMPYGPFLCLAALVVIVRWPAFWTDNVMVIFEPGWLVPAAAGVCVVALIVVLGIWRFIRGRFAEA